MLKNWSDVVKMQKRLYEGKTQKEWFEQLSESIEMFNLSLNEGNIQDKEKEIVFYFDNNGNILSYDIVKNLMYWERIDGFLSKNLKDKINIDDNWKDNCIIIDSESVCQLLFFMDREDILSTIKDMMKCLCK